MGDYTYSKTKLGRSIAQHKLIPTKILSILLAILMVTTIFSSMALAEEGEDDPIGDDDNGSDENVGKHVESQSSTFRDLLRNFMQQRREERKGIFSLEVVTNYKDLEKSTRLRALLPTSIDIDDDGDKDIRVWVIRRPALQLLPPSVGLKTSLLIRRLPGLEETQINDALELYLDFTPRLASRLSNDMNIRVRIGYESPEGEEIPKSCLVYHKTFPQLAYPRQKTKHTVGINPISIVGKSQLNLLFSIAGVDNDTAGSELMIQVNHCPAIKNEITFSRSKDRFVIRGQTLDIKRSSTGKSNVSVFIKDLGSLGKGSLVVNDIPKKISLSWRLARTGYLKLNSYSAGTGAVKAAVDGLMAMGFTAETGINAGIEWQNLGLRSFTKGKSFGLSFNTEDSMALSNFYLDALLEDLGYNLGITSTLLALKLKAGVDVAKLVLTPAIEVESIDIDVDNADVVLEDCIVDLEFVGVPEIPTVTITSPEDDATVNGTVTITGTASAPSGRDISYVQLQIDDGEPIDADGTTSWSYDWDTTVLANGEHTISAISEDNEGFKSDEDVVSVIVDNPGNNWYPLVTIDALPIIIQSDAVTISGIASDPDGDEQLMNVEVRINEDEWQQVEGTTSWSYEWDVSKLTGLYTIEARSYDGEDYSPIVYTSTFIRFSSVLDITLGHASLDLKNFVVQGDINLMNITKIDVSSFSVEGSGAFYLGEEAISVNAEGALHLNDTSITITNSSGGSEKLLDTLKADIVGDGRLDIVPKAVSAVLNANVDITAKEALGLNDIKLAFVGNISAHMAIDESGNVALGGDKKEDHFYMNIQDFVFALGTLVDVGADQLLINGTGNVSVIEDELIISGDLNECIIDNFHVSLGIANFSFSGAVDRIRNGILSVSLTDLFNFSISYDGEYDLTILNPQVSIKSTSGNVSILANKIMVRTDGFAIFGYSKNETQAEVSLVLKDIKFIGLCLYFDEFSFGPTDLGWNGSFHLILSADLFIEMGEDWIKITIGGRGRVHIDVHTTLTVNETSGPLDVEMDMKTGEDIFVIYVNYSVNKSFYVDGSASVNIEEFKLMLPDIVNISIERLTVGFDMNASGENGSILLDIDNVGIALDGGHIALSIDGAFNFSLAGTIDVSSTGNVSGTVSATFNETGLINLSVDFDAAMTVDITNLDITYNKTNTSTAVSLSADQIAIGGSGYIVITPDYIAAGITTSDGGLGGGSKVPGEGEGIVLKNFSLNATDMLADINILADIGFLQIEGNLDINYSDDIIIDASAGLTGENISLFARIHSMKMYASVQMSSFEISGDGGGTITIVDKNVSMISGETTSTDIIVKGLFVDVVYPDMLLFLMLEDANISFTGADVIVSIDLMNMIINAEFSGDAHVTINTLWVFLSTTFMEIRLHSVELDGPTTITMNVEEDVLVTIHTDGTIYAGEFTLVDLVSLYDVSGGPDISVGVDSVGNLLAGFNGTWHFGKIFLGILISDIDFEGKIEPTVLGFGYLMAWIHIEGYVGESSTIGVGPLNLILEPGYFVIHIDGIDTIDLDNPPVNIGLLLYLESPIKVQGRNILEGLTIVEGRGYLEANFNINSLDFIEHRDIDIEVDGKWNGDFAFLGHRIDITGECSGNVALEVSGSLGDGDLYGSLQADLEGTHYMTIFPALLPNAPLGVRFAVDREAHVDFDFGSDPDSGDLIIETAEETIILTQEGETIVMNENGEVVYQSTQGSQGGNSPLGGEGDEWNLFDEDFYLWIWNPITQQWFPFWVEGPPLEGAVTLLSREVGDNALLVNSIEIIPGDKVNFTAWYMPAEGSGGGSGHYNFVFDYGDGSDPQTIPVDYQDGPIIIHPDEHLYAAPDTCTVTVTVIDTAHPGEAVGDAMPAYIVEKYLALSDNNLQWDYVDVADDGKLYGSFEVRNRANVTYSNNYTFSWSIDNIDVVNMKWGTNWTFEPMNGILAAEESQVVNVSFTPPLEKRDYEEANITVINDDKPEENKTLDFYVEYGLVEVFPVYTVTVFVMEGETTTLNDVFWVYSNRWEELGWEVSEISLPDHLLVSCIPENGVIRPGDPPSEIALDIDASDEEFTEGSVEITVQRVGDPSDNDSVKIYVKTISGGGGSGPTPDWVTPDDHVNNWWAFEGRAHDNKLNKAASYRRSGDDGWTDDSIILTLDSSISCSGFRINAKSGDHLEKMRIKLYRQGTEVQTTELTSWEDDDWEDVIFGSSVGQVDTAKISFKLESGYTYGGLDPHWAVVWEFDFLKES